MELMNEELPNAAVIIVALRWRPKIDVYFCHAQSPWQRG